MLSISTAGKRSDCLEFFREAPQPAFLPVLLKRAGRVFIQGRLEQFHQIARGRTFLRRAGAEVDQNLVMLQSLRGGSFVQ